VSSRRGLAIWTWIRHGSLANKPPVYRDSRTTQSRASLWKSACASATLSLQSMPFWRGYEHTSRHPSVSL
jgi:hypothetical protein